MNKIKQLSLVLFCCIVLFSLMSAVTKGQTATTNDGIQGHEWNHATAKFSDIEAYDAAHPEIRANQKSPVEVEFNHGDIIERKHGVKTSQKHNAEKSAHGMKSVLPASPAPVTTFTGETGTSGVEPPDVSGAVGPTHVVTTHNQDVKISTRAGVQVSSVALTSFWSPIGATMSSDPKIVYDPSADRFIFVCLVNYTTAAPLIGIAVTQTNNPTGTWNFFSVNVDPTGTTFLDYPELGYNKNWVSVGGNYFNQTSQNFAGAGLFVINKPALYNNTGAIFTKFTGAQYFDTANDFCITPASIADTTVNDLFLLESFDGSQGQFKQFVVSGTPSIPHLSSPQIITTSFLWSGANGANLGPQLGTTTPIDLDDDRITGSVVYRNGHLWVAHMAYLPEASPTRSAAHWMELDTIGNIIQDAMIDDPTNLTSYAYPAIAVGSNGNAIIAYSNLSSTHYASCGYSFRVATDPINMFRGLYQYKAGGSTYAGGRWGDYSFACIDPVDDSTFWVVTEYATATANQWGTWWAEVNPICLTPFTPVAIIGPTSICSNNLNSLYYSIVPVFGATSYTWTVSGTGWSSVASTTDSILVTPGAGTGIITVTATNSCGSNAAQTLTVMIPNGTPAIPSPIVGNVSVCNGTLQTYSVTLDTTVTNYTWSLPANWTGTSSTNSIHTTINNNGGTIMVNATNGCGTTTWDSLVVSLPTAPTAASPFTINCMDSILLTASGSNTIAWYNLPSGGSPLDTGTTYNTGALSYTTTFYVENQLPGASDYCTPFDSAQGAGAFNTFTHSEIFNVLSPCTLVSVLVYAQAGGNRTINLYDPTGTIINTLTTNIPAGHSRVTLNFQLPVGSGLALECSGTPNLYRNSSGANYPYNDAAGLVSITGNDVPDPARYYFFYDWELQGAPCGSGRIPVVVNVNNGVLASFTDTQVGNTYTFTSTSVGATTWHWDFGDGNTSNLPNPVHSYPAVGTYIVTLTVNNGSCIDSTTQIITITTGISILNESTSVNIYPNPVNDKLNINIQSSVANNRLSINLYDAIGQIVLKNTLNTVIGNNQIELYLSFLNKGIYILEIKSTDGKIIRKIVKE